MAVLKNKGIPFIALLFLQMLPCYATDLQQTPLKAPPKNTLILTKKATILPPVTGQGSNPLKLVPSSTLEPTPLKPLAPLKINSPRALQTKPLAPSSEPTLPDRGRQMLNGVSHLIDRGKDTLQQKGPITSEGGILILPILHHGKEKAFYDVALPIANALADQLANRINDPRFLAFPSTTMSEIEAAGLRPLYDQLAEQVDSTGRPEARLQQDLIEQLLASPSSSLSAESGGHLVPVRHVIWVTADADLNHPTQARNLWERFHRLASDNLPQDANLFVSASIRVFKTGDSLILTTHKQANASVPAQRFVNITPSVYQDRDSTQAFNSAGRVLAGKLLWGLGSNALGEGIKPSSSSH